MNEAIGIKGNLKIELIRDGKVIQEEKVRYINQTNFFRNIVMKK